MGRNHARKHDAEEKRQAAEREAQQIEAERKRREEAEKAEKRRRQAAAIEAERKQREEAAAKAEELRRQAVAAQIAEKIQRGYIALKAGKSVEAECLFEEAIASMADCPQSATLSKEARWGLAESRYLQARAAWTSGKNSKAWERIEKALAACPEHEEAQALKNAIWPMQY